MISALQTALAAYTARGDAIAGVAQKLASPAPGASLVKNMVDLMVHHRGAEADLAVARVANATEESLVHVIA